MLGIKNGRRPQLDNTRGRATPSSMRAHYAPLWLRSTLVPTANIGSSIG